MKVRWFAVAMYLGLSSLMYVLTSFPVYPLWARGFSVLFGLFLAFVLVNVVDER